jgi:cell division protein FtsQ
MPREKARPKIRWRLWLSVLAFCGLCVSSAVAARKAHRYVLTNPQFRLPAGARGALQFDGTVYASRSKLTRIFSPDFGRSIFAIPLAERRRRLLAVDWVEDASVSRLWPNGLLVHVQERRPVAFVSIPLRHAAGSPARFLLVDAQGVLLDPPPRAQFAFPVLTGITDDQTDAERRVRVQAALRLLQDLGPLAQNISEINVAVPDDLRVEAEVQRRLLELDLGGANFAQRLQNFLAHYPEIRKRAPNGSVFDLRLDDRITAKD